jgi:hypothetical protein
MFGVNVNQRAVLKYNFSFIQFFNISNLNITIKKLVCYIDDALELIVIINSLVIGYLPIFIIYLEKPKVIVKHTDIVFNSVMTVVEKAKQSGFTRFD